MSSISSSSSYSSSRDVRIIAEQVVHVTSTFDPSTRLPLVVIDSTELPTPSSDLYSALVPAVISKLPKNDYVLLFFACGAPNKPSWSWVAKTYSVLDHHAKKRVKKVYVVHESWWVRAITEMLRGVVSSKFRKKVIHVSSLSQLAQLIDITVIDIKPKVYLHNRKIENEITIPRHPMPVFGMPLMTTESGEFLLPRTWTDGISYLLETGHSVRDLFKAIDIGTNQYHTFSILQHILRDCYDRNQLVDLNDYGPRVVASLIKLYIYQLPIPVLDASRMKVPIQDTPQYCMNIFRSLNLGSQALLADLMDLLTYLVRPLSASPSMVLTIGGEEVGASAGEVNRSNNSPGSLAACLAPSLLGHAEIQGNGGTNSASISNAVKFTVLLIECWAHVRPQLAVQIDGAYYHRTQIHRQQSQEFTANGPAIQRSTLRFDDKLEFSQPISSPAPSSVSFPFPLPLPRMRNKPSILNLHSPSVPKFEVHSSLSSAAAAVGANRSSSNSSSSSSSSGEFSETFSEISSEHSISPIIEITTTNFMVPPAPPLPRKMRAQLNEPRTSGGILQPMKPDFNSKPSMSLHISKAKPIHVGAPLSPTERTTSGSRRTTNGSGPRIRTVVRRGKMVAELARLYEEKCNTAEILVKLDCKQ